MSIPVNIYIQSKDLSELLEFYEAKLKITKQKRKDLENDESEIRATIAQLKNKMQSTETIDESPTLFSIKPNKFQYNKKWTWVEKIEFAIRESSKPLNTTEIVDSLIIHEPSLDDDKRRSVASVSSILSIHSGVNEQSDKKFIKIDRGGRSNFLVRDTVDENINNDALPLKEDKVEIIELPPPHDFDKVDDLPF